VNLRYGVPIPKPRLRTATVRYPNVPSSIATASIQPADTATNPPPTTTASEHAVPATAILAATKRPIPATAFDAILASATTIASGCDGEEEGGEARMLLVV
jgi:hypothetical protein